MMHWNENVAIFVGFFVGAIASSEVKQRLHEFVLQKKQRESMVTCNG